MKKFDEKAIIKRVKHLREQYAGQRGKSEFARALGISASTYSYYENNRVPPIEILLKICEVAGADLEWLLTGSEAGEKTADKSADRILPQKLNALLGKNPELAEAISAFIELLCEKKGIEKDICPVNPPFKPTRPGWIPVLGRTAAGMVHFWDQMILPTHRQAVTELDELVKKHIGKTIVGSADGTVRIDLQSLAWADGGKKPHASMVQVSGDETNEIIEFIQCEEIFAKFPDSFALQIDGDSMSPKINDGDIVILSPSVPAVQGHIAVVRIANQIGVTCKLIRTTAKGVHLIPINERYETKVVAEKDLLWALAVICHVGLNSLAT